KFFSRTGADGAMIGRGALGNPWIFRQTLQYFAGEDVHVPTLEEKEEMILRHLRMVVENRGELHGSREFRKHLIWYTRGLRGSSDFRSRIFQWETSAELAENTRAYMAALRTETDLVPI
ncbi:MAG TPA: tRNA-dihydrouridine synthase, partial [Thermodesulfobacteriota bacterium]|nr:tRNA-dihydrouridine synthase [Thermodesulfobacteriota bacterium]